MMPATLVFAIDDAYREPLLVALYSLWRSNRTLAGGLDIVVLHEDLSDAVRDQILRCGEALGLNVDVRRAVLPALNFNTAFGGARANYLRLAIPETVASSPRVIYLDADTLIIGDISPLLEAGLDGHPVGAVRDAINPTLASGKALPCWPQLGLDGAQEYFNSGVMVLDLPACARERVFERSFEMVAEHGAMLRLWDQDALNLAAADRWCRLPRMWNSIPFSALIRTPWLKYQAEHILPAEQLIADERTARILHFVSPAKPWRNLLPRGHARDLYQQHRDALTQVMRSASETGSR